MEKMSKKIKKKVAKQSTHCVSIWYKNNVFYWHIFVIQSLIPAEAERVGGITKQTYCHTSHTQTCTRTYAHTCEVVGIRGQGPSSLCPSLNPLRVWMELAILGFLGMLWFEMATLQIAFGAVLAGGWGFFGGSDGKESACNAGDLGSISGSERSPGMATHSNILAWEIPSTENPMGRGAWQATVDGVPKSWTRLSH